MKPINGIGKHDDIAKLWTPTCTIEKDESSHDCIFLNHLFHKKHHHSLFNLNKSFTIFISQPYSAHTICSFLNFTCVFAAIFSTRKNRQILNILLSLMILIIIRFDFCEWLKLCCSHIYIAISYSNQTWHRAGISEYVVNSRQIGQLVIISFSAMYISYTGAQLTVLRTRLWHFNNGISWNGEMIIKRSRVYKPRKNALRIDFSYMRQNEPIDQSFIGHRLYWRNYRHLPR